MEPHEYDLIYKVEGFHWWYRGMTAITKILIRQQVKPNGQVRILDAGCGTGGAMASFLGDFGDVTGIDVSPRALFYCRKRSLQALSQASVTAIPFPAGSFDLVTSFDVLYERSVDNDGHALGEFFRVLSPGGCLLLRLPAYDWLRGQHDQVVHTRQRYTMTQVKHLLSVNGFKVRMASYANMLLFLPAMVKRLGEQFLPPGIAHSDLEMPVGRLNNFLCSILSSEARFISFPGLPFGLSVFALGQKVA